MSEITKYEIDMLDVGAADAFLIHAFVKQESGSELEYVVLVDAGNECDGEKIYDHINRYYNQKYIDLVIITHCDADHYGGMKYLIDKHKSSDTFKINKVWVHDPYEHVNVDDVKYIRNSKTLRQRLDAAYSFDDGTNLLTELDKARINREEVFKGSKLQPLNITVLGPTSAFYESLIPDFRVDVDFKAENSDECEYNRFCTTMTEDEFYSKALADANDDPSAANQSSIVFKMDAKGDKLLFTGDAGKSALHKIVDYDFIGELKNITWLKVPHHGSKHNLDNELISHFHPKVSYISSKKYGTYASRCTVNALKKVGRVYSTQKDRQSLWHHRGTVDREGYSTADPM